MTTPEDPRIAKIAELHERWGEIEWTDTDGAIMQQSALWNDLGEILSERAALRGDLPASGANLIATERLRQNGSEGWTPEHDAEHSDGELVDAAVCYLAPRFSSQYWPWRPAEFKPTPNDRVRELIKAGALIAAEIDRLNGETHG